VELHPRVRVLNLLHLPPGRVPARLARDAEGMARMDAHYLLRREMIDFDRDEAGRRVADFRRARLLDCLGRLGRWAKRNRYDSFLVPNAAVYEFAAAHHLGRSRGIPVVSFDFNERKGTICWSDGVPCVWLDTEGRWRADEPHILSPEREQRVMTFLRRRERPNWQDESYVWQGQSVALEQADALRRQLRLDPGRPVALLCANIAYDSAVLGMTRAFPSMARWIQETVGWFLHRPDWQLVIRCHPAEVYWPSAEPVPGVIAARFPELPEHIHVVGPADPVNTYGLVNLCRLGLVYTTTVGLEMAVRGLPVVVAGKVHYAQKGFTTDPADPGEYFAALDRLTAPGSPAPLAPRQVELARCYADVYFFHYPRAVPWSQPGQTEADHGIWEMEDVIRHQCPREFLETFDFFAGWHLEGARRARRAA
jgi:hypothetical protein